MDEETVKNLALQFRNHIDYSGEIEQFDQEVLQLVRVVEDQCAKVVETFPTQTFSISRPESILGLIAMAIRGKL